MISLGSLKKVDTRRVAFEILTPLKKDYSLDNLDNIVVKGISIAYLLYYLAIDENTDECDLKDLLIKCELTKELKDIIQSHISDCWSIVKDNANKFTKDELAAFILFNDEIEFNRSDLVSTPRGLSKLACNLLNIESGDDVLELCSGKGGFLTEVFGYKADINYCGVELNYSANDIARIRAAVLECNAELIVNNALTYKTGTRWDKLFSNYPFMIRNKELDIIKEGLAEEYDIPKDVVKRASSDWLFNLMLINQMSKDGKAVAIMTNGSTWNRPDKAMRQYFVEKGYIETVIALPAKMLKGTTIPTTLMVLSNNNKSIKMIDAHNIYTEERRYNTLEDKDIDEIMEMTKCVGKNAVEVGIERIKKEDFVLNPVRYFVAAQSIENGVEFGSITLNIKRGAQMKADALEELRTSGITNKKYLMVSNISDGMVSIEDNQYLHDIPEKLKKYCIKNDSLVLSKTGNPGGKSAVIHVDKDDMLLAHGNIFIVELDKTKVDPYYIQAYLSSETGGNNLKSAYNGAIIRTLSLDNLKKMIIPLPPLDIQKRIANKYAATMDEVLLLKRKLEKATNRMKSVFDEEV